MTRRLKPPAATAQRFHCERKGWETTAESEKPPLPTAEESSARPEEIVAADRPESVSRFNRWRSARISAAL